MNDFKEVYDKIYPELKMLYDNEIEEMNKKVDVKKSKLLKIIAILDIIIIIALLVIIKINLIMITINITIFLVIFSFVIYSCSFFKEKREINKRFKNVVITKLIDNVYEEKCVLNMDRGITQKEYNASVYGDMYNRYYSKDLVYLKESKLFFSEVLVQYYSSNGKNSTTTTVFQGIAGQKQLSKEINCNISILSNRLFMDSRVKLDSSEFEKYFDIKSKDKILAMRFLTADIMQMMVALRERYDCRFELGIVRQVLYFRISTYNDFFETPNVKKGLDIEYLKKNTDILLQIKKLTTLINDVVKEI